MRMEKTIRDKAIFNTVSLDSIATCQLLWLVPLPVCSCWKSSSDQEIGNVSGHMALCYSTCSAGVVINWWALDFVFEYERRTLQKAKGEGFRAVVIFMMIRGFSKDFSFWATDDTDFPKHYFSFPFLEHSRQVF